MGDSFWRLVNFTRLRHSPAQMNEQFLQFRVEVRKLFTRPRTYFGFAAFLFVELLMLCLVEIEPVKASFRYAIERTGFEFTKYFSGLTLGFFVLYWTRFLIGSLFIALVAGDVVAKEVEEGTMRMLLCRPVSRGRIILVKFLACLFYAVALISFIGVTALLLGFCFEGFGGLFVYDPVTGLFVLYDFAPGLWRYFAAIPLQALSSFSIAAIAFLLSCCNVKPATASIGCLLFFFFDRVLAGIPFFSSISGWFLTNRMFAWERLFHSSINWSLLCEDYGLLIAVDATCLLAAWVIFEQRDFKA